MELIDANSGDNKHIARKEIYCETCGSNQPMIEHEPKMDEGNEYPWYDITCGTCHSIIATVQIVPDDKPINPHRQATLKEGAMIP